MAAKFTGWGSSWGAAWGGAAAEPAIITGSGTLEQPCAVVSGAGFCGFQAKASGGGGGNFSRARIPSPLDLVADVRRDRLMDALGMRLTGVGESEQAATELSGVARIKLVSLVATSAGVGVGASEAVAVAEFRDVELEMVALLLAA